MHVLLSDSGMVIEGVVTRNVLESARIVIKCSETIIVTFATSGVMTRP